MQRTIFSSLISAGIFLTVFVSGCAPKPVQKEPAGEAKKSVSKIKTSKGPYNSSEPRIFDLLHTRLEVAFNWEARQVKGNATLTIKPYFYPQDTLKLDAKGFEIHSAQLVDKGSRKDIVYNYNGNQIEITLGKSFTKTDTFSVILDYTASPDKLPEGGSEAINSDKGLYFINYDGKDPNKPRQIWTQGETEANSKWFPTIDAPNERCTQEMYITVDSAFTVLSNGEYQYTTDNGNGLKTHYWKMDKPHAPYLFMMAIGEYKIVKDKWRNLEVNYYVEPEYEKYAKSVFGNTPEMLEFFSTRLKYPYPWNKYSQVVVRDFVSGAMENTTATVFMEGLQIDDRERLDVNWDYIIAHELFHHWFGDLVTCESWSNLPLNESFANYSEYLWSEYKYGIDEADLHGEKEVSEYLDESRTKQEPLIRYNYTDKEDMFDRHSYNKGGRILHMLRKYVGDSAFFESLHLYLSRNKFTSVEMDNLRLAFEEVTGEDLNWYFNQWFLKPGHPLLKINHTYTEGRLKIKVQQVQDTTISPVYKIPVTIEYFVEGQKQYTELILTKASEEFTIPVSVEPEYIIFDSPHSVLAEKEHPKTKVEYISQFRNAAFYLDRKEAIVGLLPSDSIVLNQNINLKDSQIRQILLEGLQDKFWAIRNLSLEYISYYQIENPEYYSDVVKKLALSDEKSDVRASAMYFLSKYYNVEYKDVYLKGLKDKAYSVVAASLSAFLKTGDTTETVALTEFEKLNNLDIMLTISNYYLSRKIAGKYVWLKEKLLMNKSVPKNLYNLMFFYGEYTLKLGSLEEKEDARKILEDIYNSTKYDVIKQLARKYSDKIGGGK